MKHYHITAIAFCLLMATHVSPGQERKFGLGLIFGEPTGVSAKYWLSSTTALDFALGGGLFREGGVHFHMDYLWHSFDAIKSTERFPVYYGVGGSINAEGENSLAARGVIGVAWLSHDTPVDVFLEFAPTLRFSPSTDFVVEGGAGVRYFF